ncbi:MAG: UDP-N-acetylglucosamine 2-epimerase (non-hydrolyzing) [Syntrophobacteraceae bacterium]
MKILSVVGARPNFMKIAPIIRAIHLKNRTHQGLADRDSCNPTIISHILVHTGQHYDKGMSDAFFRDLDLPAPDIFLGVGSGTHAVQTSEIIRRFEPILLDHQPDLMIVVGDVNSTVACAMVAAKLTYEDGKRTFIAHVEAGLRSFDRSMPEEINRIVTDHISDLLFVTEQSGVDNLKREGIAAEKIFFVGNTMIDTLLAFRDLAAQSDALHTLGLVEPNGRMQSTVPYALVTLHRPSNVDNRVTFLEILKALKKISEKMPVIFPVHPRTRKQIASFQVANSATFNGNGSQIDARPGPGDLCLIDPLGYLDFLCLMSKARIVLTDSGGIQEETTCLGVPCVTIRRNTERPVTVANGTNILSGVEMQSIVDASNEQLNKTFSRELPECWDGNAACRIIDIIVEYFKVKGIDAYRS